MARERNAHISKANGPVVANQTLRAFRTCFNFASRAQDVPLGDNPVDAVTFHPERSANRSIAIPDLPGWYAKAQKLPNPLRVAMHELGLFSGLRPETSSRSSGRGSTSSAAPSSFPPSG